MAVRRLLSLALMLAAGLLLPAAGARGATTVRVFDKGILFVDGDESDNALTLRVATVDGAAGGRQTVTIEEAAPGGTISASDGCQVEADGRRATCRGVLDADVDGGAGDDSLTTDGVAAHVAGGEGADTLTAVGATRMFLSGGAGDDRLRGGDSNDDLDGGPGADAMSGGGGTDFADYRARTEPLTLSNDGVANDGEPGEGDDIGTDVEQLSGGAGDDRLVSAAPGVGAWLSGAGGADTLIGGDGGDNLSGGDGDDILVGGGGDDLLDGEAGANRVDAGAGDDRVLAVTALGSDDVHGGPGVDLVMMGPGPLRFTTDGQADDGRAGEHNVHPDVESLSTWDGDATVVTGDAANNIRTGVGNDMIDPGGGTDVVDAFDGDDRVLARDGAADRVDCGKGTDTAVVDELDTTVGCESVDRADVVAPQLALTGPPARIGRSALRQRGVRFAVRPSERVRLRATLAARSGRVLARRTSGLTSRERTLALRIPARRTRGLGATLRLTVTAVDAAGRKVTLRRSIRLVGGR